ncbi:MAG: ATP-binding cassette domain-containing protein [Beijerinckiaceae bacterium]
MITSVAAPHESGLVSGRKIGVRRDGRWLIRDVDIAVHRGEIVTLIGPNGGGKSTTAKALLGLTSLDAGAVERIPGLRTGYVPQRIAVDRTLPLSVARLMTLTMRHSDHDVAQALEMVGIAHLAQSPVQNLSGGEFQRALLARAIVRKPDLLVLDEPVQGVDFSGEIALYRLIGEIRRTLGCGVLLISHDLHIVMAETDTVVCLNGHVCCAGAPGNVTKSVEYLQLFGAHAADAITVYRHTHDHEHAADGSVVSHDCSAHDHDHGHGHSAGQHHDHAHAPPPENGASVRK